ncbi:hypothetical protein [Mycobacterium sp.]
MARAGDEVDLGVATSLEYQGVLLWDVDVVGSVDTYENGPGDISGGRFYW